MKRLSDMIGSGKDGSYKRQDIAGLFGSEDQVSFKRDYARIKALVWIYEMFQEDTEKQHGTTSLINGVGFTGVDGHILSSFAKQVKTRYFLSDKQMQILRKKIKKYENQMTMISNWLKTSNKRPDTSYMIDDIMKKWMQNNFPKYPSMNESFEDFETEDEINEADNLSAFIEKAKSGENVNIHAQHSTENEINESDKLTTVIGKTKSGKNVYAQYPTEALYPDFTSEDHRNAAKLHMRIYNRKEGTADTHYVNHADFADVHTNKAFRMEKKAAKK